jgi:hypothetical protein
MEPDVTCAMSGGVDPMTNASTSKAQNGEAMDARDNFIALPPHVGPGHYKEK